jgi:hypothetical protein
MFEHINKADVTAQLKSTREHPPSWIGWHEFDNTSGLHNRTAYALISPYPCVSYHGHNTPQLRELLLALPHLPPSTHHPRPS